MDNVYNYSIIIPHKNIPALLHRCIDSIPFRDDVQVIVVDDNSDSSVVDFENFPGRGRKNTEIYFTKHGKGAGYARNIGLEHAKGKWLIFADADDFFNECFNDALDQYINNESDMIFFYCNSVDCYTLENSNRSEPRNEILDKVKIEENCDYLRYRLYSPCGKFVKRNLTIENKIEFQEVFYSNDVMFSIYLGAKANKIILSDYIIYCMTNRSDSLEGHQSVDSIKIRLNVASAAYKYLKQIGKEKYTLTDLMIHWNFILSNSKITGAKALPLLFRNCGMVFTIKNFLLPLLFKIIK